MAKQGGILGIRGTVGGLTFRRDGSVSQAPAKRQITAPRSLENGREFGTAATAGKLLRDGLRAAISNIPAKGLAGRMTQVMRRIVGEDATSVRGARKVLKANIGQLMGFELNLTAALSSVFYATYSVTVIDGAGQSTISIPSINPLTDLAAPQGATHFAVVADGVVADFEAGTSEPASMTLQPAASLTGGVLVDQDIAVAFAKPPAPNESVVMALGVVFYQEINDELYPLANGAYAPLAIVCAY
jgi:hypothetical protein